MLFICTHDDSSLEGNRAEWDDSSAGMRHFGIDPVSMMQQADAAKVLKDYGASRDDGRQNVARMTPANQKQELIHVHNQRSSISRRVGIGAAFDSGNFLEPMVVYLSDV